MTFIENTNPSAVMPVVEWEDDTRPATRVVRQYAPSGNHDNDYFVPSCFTCGWRGAAYSNRTTEGRTLAEKRTAEHVCERRNG